MTPGAIEEGIANGHIDYGITNIPNTTAGVDHFKIKDIEIGIYTKPKAFHQTPFLEIPFAVPTTELSRNSLNLISLDGWDNRLPRKVLYEFELLETALLMTRAGAAAICLPHFLGQRREFGLVHYTQTPKNLKFPKMGIYLVKSSTLPETNDFKRLAKGIRLSIQRP